MQGKQGLSQLDKKIIGALLIALLAIVIATSLSYFIFGQTNQTPISPSPTPTLTPEPTPTSSPLALKPADLVLDCTLGMAKASSYRPNLMPRGTITNIGEETAGNITLHIRTWFSNGTEAIVLDVPLYWQVFVSPPLLVSIAGNSTYRFGVTDEFQYYYIPDFAIGTDWTNATAYSDCISSYQITATWISSP